MLSEGSIFLYLIYVCLPFQGEDGPPGNGTIGFTGAPVSFLPCLETVIPLCLPVQPNMLPFLHPQGQPGDRGNPGINVSMLLPWPHRICPWWWFGTWSFSISFVVEWAPWSNLLLQNPLFPLPTSPCGGCFQWKCPAVALTPKGSNLGWVLSDAVSEPEFGVGSVTQESWMMLWWVNSWI